MSSAKWIEFERSPSSIDALDGLRSIAIILVILRHSVRPFTNENQEPLLPVFNWDLADVFLNGWIGVDLFFVLSGFLIAHHLMKRGSENLTLKSYARYITARGLRILPAYYLVIGLIISGFFIGYNFDDQALGLKLVYHALLFQDVLPSSINVAFWSLGVEWKFYLLAPFIIYFLCRLENPKIALLTLGLLICLPLLFRSMLAYEYPVMVAYTEYFPHFRSSFYMCFEGLLVGVLCAFIFTHKDQLPIKKYMRSPDLVFYLGIIGLLVLMIPAPLLDNGAGKFAQTLLQTVIAVFWGMVMLGTLFGGGPITFLSHKIFLVIARLSYVAYLVHMPLIPLSLIITSLIFASVTSGVISFVISLFILCVLTSILSMIIHFCVEKPCTSFGHLMRYKPAFR